MSKVEVKTNKEKVTEVLESLASGDKSAIEKYVSGEKYIQHNLAFPSGRETILGALGILKESGTKVNIIRVFEDGEYIFAHTEYFLFGKNLAGFDIFRFENGKIVEHWDNLQENKGVKNPSGRTMFDGEKEVKDITAKEKNKKTIKEFFETILIGGDFSKMADYFDGDNYIQHNPNIGDGLSGLGKGIEEMAKAGIAMKFDKVRMVLGEGNFVLICTEGKLGEKATSYYDLFRVENGKILEHWDTIEEIPSKDQWKNNNGKY